VLSRFPFGRALHRAYIKAVDNLTALWGALAISVVFALVSAWFVLPEKSAWGERFAVGLVSAFAAYAVLLGVAIAWQMYGYRRSGHEDDNWIPAATLAGNGAQFLLMRRDDAMPYPLTGHGRLECVIRGPAGLTIFPDSKVYRRGDGEAFVQIANGPGDYSGTYEVRWCGTRRSGRWPYEIAREKFVLAHRPP
jgi:hypothetical protein